MAALAAREKDDVVVITKGGQLVRMPADEIRECGRATQGVRVARVDEGDSVVAIAAVPGGEVEAVPDVVADIVPDEK